jgi:hypothetical protein
VELTEGEGKPSLASNPSRRPSRGSGCIRNVLHRIRPGSTCQTLPCSGTSSGRVVVIMV